MKHVLTLLLFPIATLVFALGNNPTNGNPNDPNLIARANGFMQQTSKGFEENKGQVTGEDANRVKFMLKDGNLSLFLMNDGIAYQFNRVHYPKGYSSPDKLMSIEEQQRMEELAKEIRLETYRMDVQLVGANPNARITTEGKSNDYVQYYNHNALNVHNYSKITYHEVYSHIDWVIYSKDGHTKYDFVVRPGGDPNQIKLKTNWVEDLHVNADGSLSMKNKMGEITEKNPLSFQGGKEIRTQFVLKNGTIGFNLDTYSKNEELIIDPTLIWATYYGGGLEDHGFGCDVDNSGNVYLAGETSSNNNIASGGHQNTYSALADAFLVKFDSNGIRLWATYYGSTANDRGRSCAVDANGNVYLAGFTASTAGISQGGFQDIYGGGTFDAFLVKFDGAGTRQWATYYGSLNEDVGLSCATDNQNNVYLAGHTASGNLGSAGHQNGSGGNVDAFLVKFSTSGTRIWGTYYGGTNGDQGFYCSTDQSGNVYLAGRTLSANNIFFQGHQSTLGGSWDAFLVKFNSDGQRLWGTYFGHTGIDYGYGVAIDPLGNVLLTGQTNSTSNIAFGGHQNTLGGDYDAFLAKFNAQGMLSWSTYYGGTNYEEGISCFTNEAGSIYLTGYTASSDNISFNGFQNTNGGNGDGFLVNFSQNGTRIWGTYYGGNQVEISRSGIINAEGNVFIAGRTVSTASIALNGHQNTYGGGLADAFLAKIQVPCPPDTPFGLSTQEFCGSATIDDLNIIGYAVQWYAAVSGGSPLLTNTSLVNGTTYFASQTINGCESTSRFAVSVIIHPIPFAPAANSTETFCNGATIGNLSAIGSNIKWYNVGSGGTPLSSSTLLVDGTTYYASQTANSCESVDRLPVTISINTSCLMASLHFDGVNDVVNVPTAVHTPITTAGTLEAWIKTPNAGSGYRGIVVREFYYGLFLNNNQLMTFNWTGNGTPGETTYTGVTLNDNEWHHVALSFQLGVTNGTQMFIDGQPVGAPITLFTSTGIRDFRIGNNGTSNSYFQGNIDDVKIWSRSLSAQEIFDSYNCETAVHTNLNAYYRFNQGNPGQNNAGLTTLLDESGLNNNGVLVGFALNGATSNWVFGSNCLPDQCPTPTGASSQSFCTGATVADLVAIGQNIQWYADPIGGSPLVASTLLVNGNSYYATQTTASCESSNRLAVAAIVNTIPTAPTGASAQTTCGGTLANLTVTGSNIQWYSASTGGSPLASNTPLVNGNTYFASQTVNGCESTDRLAVTVTSETSAPTAATAQEYCDGATLNSLSFTITGSNILFYSAPTGGSPLAFNTPLVNGTTYYVSQTVNSCESVTRLAITTTVYTFTNNMSAPSPQEFCGGATVANLVATGTPGATISWFTNSNGWLFGATPLPSSTQLVNNTTYYAGQSFGTNDLCKYVGTAGALVIINSPTAPTGSAAQTFCNSATVANLSATGTGIQWYTVPTGGTAISAGTALTDGTTYYASQTVSGCESTDRLAVLVTINTTSAPTGANTQSVCSGATIADLSATGTSIQWYDAPTGGTALAAGTVLTNGTTYYASQTANGCESATRLDVNVVFGIPNAPTGAAAQTFCNSATVADLVVSGSNIQWYAASSGGTALAAGTALTTGSTYYASQTSGGCESTDRLEVTATINIPAAPIGTVAQEFCNSATVADLTATGSGIQWYTAPSGGTALTSGTALSNGTYYASQTISGCESINRLEVTVTINIPSAPTGTTTQSFCGTATLADITVTGANITWYDAASLGTVLGAGTALADGVTYFASQTVNGCESINRLAVTATVNAIPAAPTASAAQEFCNNATVANLSATGTAIQWYAAASGGTALAVGTVLNNGTTYHASQTVNGCESTDRLAVTVTINAPATPTGTANQEFCNAATVADLTATGSGIEWYTAPSGGTALTSGTALSNGTYYASQTISGCESINRLEVTVIINTPAAPTGTANQTFCGTAALADITVTGANITWYDATSAGTVLGAGTALADGVTYFASQTVNGCESINRLAVTATVNAIPSAPAASASQEFCNSATVADLTATGSGVQWFTAANGGTALSTGTTLASGSYFASQTVNGCESTDRTEVTVNIITPAAPTGDAAQNFCSASTVADLTATGTAIQWYTQATGGTALATGTALSNGTYYASQTINGCESERLEVTVTVTILDATVTENGLTLTANQAGATYTWVDCNNSNQPIAGETAQSFTATANGSYAVIVELNGCSVTSNCVAITTVGLDDIKTELFRVYPNPASTVINVEMANTSTIRLFDVSGKLLKELNGSSNYTIDVTELTPGMYLIESAKGAKAKFVKE